MSSTIDALILAAGKSTRMGTTKSLLNWRGEELVNYQINTLIRAGCDRINLVLGYDSENILKKIKNLDINIIYNENFEKGKSSSILSGINSINNKNLLMIGVDQPRPLWFLKSMMEFHINTKSKISAPLFNNKRGHPIIFNNTFYANILRINQYKNGLKDIFRENNSIVKTININSQWTHLDLNDKKTYKLSLGLNLEKNEE
jgi:molybdenum cofactor cytidylyltransferase|tara:strand:- start:11552 stop:12157 length:606 start_codon:yes stop_codon:yes gene_type:complete